MTNERVLMNNDYWTISKSLWFKIVSLVQYRLITKLGDEIDNLDQEDCIKNIEKCLGHVQHFWDQTVCTNHDRTNYVKHNDLLRLLTGTSSDFRLIIINNKIHNATRNKLDIVGEKLS